MMASCSENKCTALRKSVGKYRIVNMTYDYYCTVAKQIFKSAICCNHYFVRFEKFSCKIAPVHKSVLIN